MKLNLILLISLVTIISEFGEVLSQNNVQKNIDDIFGTQKPPKMGINDIVTSVPIDVPETTPSSGSSDDMTSNCTCVPYHECNPSGNEVDMKPRWEIDFRNVFSGVPDCPGALDVCCAGVTSKPVTTMIPEKPKPHKSGGCGVRNENGLDFNIINGHGRQAGFGEFPWTVALLRNSESRMTCAGSLIHPRVVLTAAHCVSPFMDNPRDLKIRAGEYDSQTTSERLPFQELTVSRIILHQNYDRRDASNDFALIELENEFQLDEHIGTVCLPPNSFVPNQQNCFANGWGKNEFGTAGVYSSIMKKVPLGIVNFSRCERLLQETPRLGNQFRLHNSFICAGGIEGVDTCEGDVGAALVCLIGRPGDNRYAQNGIVSWGIGCNQAVPGVYANVAMARDWIDAQMQSIGLNSTSYTFQ